MASFAVWYWPLLSAFWGLGTFIATYFISTGNGHVYWFFPYISDTGTRPPESCIFAQLLNIEMVLLGITLYLRYKQLKIAIEHTNAIGHAWNRRSLPLGLAACLGISMVGNFQQTNVQGVHLLGAFMAFGVGMFYFIMQARITYAFRNVKERAYGAARWLYTFRILNAALFCPLFFIGAVCGTMAALEFQGESIEYWTREDGAFGLRLTSTFSEWVCAVLMMSFVASFAIELRTIRFKKVAFESADYLA